MYIFLMEILSYKDNFENRSVLVNGQGVVISESLSTVKSMLGCKKMKCFYTKRRDTV